MTLTTFFSGIKYDYLNKTDQFNNFTVYLKKKYSVKLLN